MQSDVALTQKSIVRKVYPFAACTMVALGFVALAFLTGVTAYQAYLLYPPVDGPTRFGASWISIMFVPFASGSALVMAIGMIMLEKHGVARWVKLLVWSCVFAYIVSITAAGILMQ